MKNNLAERNQPMHDRQAFVAKSKACDTPIIPFLVDAQPNES
jgi:hypothetical protein